MKNYYIPTIIVICIDVDAIPKPFLSCPYRFLKLQPAGGRCLLDPRFSSRSTVRSDGIFFISGCWFHECGAAGAAAHEVEAIAARDAYIRARLQGAVFYALPCCTS